MSTIKKQTVRGKRIGIFHGKFDPPHYGHLFCASRVLEHFKLDFVSFVVCATPPNKPVGALDAEDRYAMVVAAVEETPGFTTSRADLHHGGQSYSLTTVEAIREQYGPDNEYFYITSSEYLDPAYKDFLGGWIGGKEMFKLCTFIVFPRESTEIAEISEWVKHPLLAKAKIEVMDLPSPPLSSSMLRDLVADGRSIDFMTPYAVQAIIKKKGHYRTLTPPTYGPPFCSVPPEKIKRLGVMAGSFDPITYGDLFIGNFGRQAYSLDRVLYVPSAIPPNNTQVSESAEARYKMVVAATANNEFFDDSRIDLARGTTSYALLTAQELIAKYGKDVEISWFLAADFINPDNEWCLPNWMGGETFMKMVSFLVFARSSKQLKQAAEWAKQLKERYPYLRMEVMSDCPCDFVESHTIRKLVSEGRSTWFTTTWGVQQIIAKEKLYLPEPAAKRSSRAKAKKAPAKKTPPKASPKPRRKA
ncbi:MAG: adenylyltransferase/cytidyltransferase family protein [Cyanobacteria bacterium REEB67]|nr:adenylyltransferase/cytidyltransferase family protein [Cyanobacteria bacterium REEB67]